MEEIKNKILTFFNNINLNEETHTYTIDNNKQLKISVSGLIKKYKYPTDWSKVLKATAKKLGVEEKEVSNEWKQAADLGCAIGDKAHLFGEDYALNRDLKASTGYEKAIIKFWNDLPEYIVPLVLEVRMYHKKYLFAGTADIILYNTISGKIYIADYKTNKDLFKNYKKQKMVGPFGNLLCSPYNHYQLQLSYYQILLEQIPGIKISGRKLIWLKPEGEYLLYNLEDYTTILKEELKDLKL